MYREREKEREKEKALVYFEHTLCTKFLLAFPPPFFVKITHMGLKKGTLPTLMTGNKKQGGKFVE